jgi:L-lactate dehydrogenase complex protein LldG
VTEGRDELVARFAREADAAGATVHGPMAEADAALTMLDLARDAGATRLLAWSPEALGFPTLADALSAAGVSLESLDLPEDPAARISALDQVEQVPVGLTGVLGALADTGSIVLAGGPGRPRLAWLLPPVHVALVEVEAIEPTFASWLASPAGRSFGASAHLALVTGPSRTADIELTLTRGVHGPKALHLVLVRRAGCGPS